MCWLGCARADVVPYVLAHLLTYLPTYLLCLRKLWQAAVHDASCMQAERPELCACATPNPNAKPNPNALR